MTNIVFKSSFDREVEIDPGRKQFRVAGWPEGHFHGWTSYESTSCPIGLGHVRFLEATGGEVYDGWPEVAFNFVEFVGLRDSVPLSEPEVWSQALKSWVEAEVTLVPPFTAADWQRARALTPGGAHGLFGGQGVRYDPTPVQSTDLVNWSPPAVPDLQGLDLFAVAPSEDRWQALLDAVMSAPDPTVAQFKISEAAEEMHEILERRSAGPVMPSDALESGIGDFFDGINRPGDAGKWFVADEEPDLLIAVGKDGSAIVCVRLTTIDPVDFDTTA